MNVLKQDRQAAPYLPTWVVVALLTVANLAVFFQVRHFGFVNLDDSIYVYQNAMTLKGLTAAGTEWAFSGFHASNWHPLTWLSHMLDVSLFGPAPGPQHLVNLLFHAVNCGVLFVLLRRLFKEAWRSALVAALFAIHPLHVESVAWISERKDVLSALFFLLCLNSYVTFSRSDSYRSYLASLGFFALGILSKPMVITLPVVLLILDWWPLHSEAAPAQEPRHGRYRRLILTKLPFLLISAATAIVTFLAQASGGGASAMSPIPLVPRLVNAAIAAIGYLQKTLWPVSLASFYPHPATVSPDLPLGRLAVAICCLLLISYFCIRERRRRPYLLWGWLWYLVMLLPVIGIIQVGGQAMADRYSYLPLIGVFVSLVFGGAELVERVRLPGWASCAAAGLLLSVLAVVAHQQAGYWRDSVTLHERSLAVTERNWKAWQGLADAKIEAGSFDDAITAGEQATGILPTFPEGWQTMGIAYASKGDYGKAVACFKRALELRPDYFNAVSNLGSVAGNLGDFRQAADYFRQALRIKPGDPETMYYLGMSLFRAGDTAGANEMYRMLSGVDEKMAQKMLAKFAR